MPDRRTLHRVALAALAGLMASPLPAAEVRVAATEAAAVAAWDARIESGLREGSLRERLVREDTLLPGRVHERYTQLHRGVPVFGGELVRQTDGVGTVTVFGTAHEGISVDTTPRLGEAAAVALLRARGGELFGSKGGPELMVLPRDEGGYALAWRTRSVHGSTEGGFDIRMTFVDAGTGEVLLDYSDLHTQSVGTGTGVLADTKKMSTRGDGATFTTEDRLRPPQIRTYDYRGNLARVLAMLNSTAFPAASDLATDTDNVWTDGATVDAHTYAGWTYDYIFKRFGRRGLDNANITIHSVVHPVRRDDLLLYNNDIIGTFFLNAFYAGDGLMVYGEGLPSGFVDTLRRRWNFTAGAFDIVAHELTHGVTDYSSNLVYRNESGALNEAFSDIVAAGAEFFHQPAGAASLQADWLIGEDVITPGGLRSMQNPLVLNHPDHYSIRFTGTADNGGVHINSGIANHAFYLAIEGGTHRLGTVVQGVGAANREQVERAFFRAFTAMLPPSATFATARAATIQSARELYGAGSAAERAITQAWTAVGVN